VAHILLVEGIAEPLFSLICTVRLQSVGVEGMVFYVYKC
jgi:hypothetical protein